MIRLRTFIRTLAALLSLGAALVLMTRSGLPAKIELSQGGNGSGAGLEIGSPAAQFQLLKPSGESVTLDSEAGMVTLINFWATWCAPCRQEMRDLQQLQSSRPDSIRVLAVNMGESATLVAAWQSELGLSYDLLLDSTLSLSKQYMVRGIPTSYLLDSSQRIRNVYYGPVTARQLERDIQRLTRRA